MINSRRSAILSDQIGIYYAPIADLSAVGNGVLVKAKPRVEVKKQEISNCARINFPPSPLNSGFAISAWRDANIFSPLKCDAFERPRCEACAFPIDHHTPKPKDVMEAVRMRLKILKYPTAKFSKKISCFR